ncbi:MAG: serine/threonine protein kinase [Deltaproteobacteria bacterium]|nr:serine/threonine protein kinase [Deltaproteobacteria bacterium]
MAEVFKAYELSGPHAGRPVAIKRLLKKFANDAEYVELFVAEADLTRMLHYPSIVEVYETGLSSDQYFMAMEFIDGRDLGQVLRRCRERNILLPVDFAVFLVVTLLEALGYAHSAPAPSGKPLGIVHCDISPSNLFVSRVGEVKLGDFGIARVKSRDSDASPKIWGKPYYLSPEILEGQVDPAADLWAAAASLYELLCNQRPFSGADPEEVMAAIRKAEPRRVRALRPEVSEALEDVVLRALARDRAARFPDAVAFADALRPHFDELIGNPMAIAAVVRGLFGA